MTHDIPPDPSTCGPRRATETQSALRRLAREAAEAGEPLARIGRRLNIPKTTLARWAQEDGFRKQDIAARKGAARQEAAEADKVRRRAEEAARRTVLAEDEDGESPVLSGADEEIVLARARVGALLDAGMIDEAEADMRAARKLTSLAGFAGPVRKATHAARGRIERKEGQEDLFRSALQVCACWEEGAKIPDHLPWLISGMYLKRIILCRDIMWATFANPETDTDESLTYCILMLATADWFDDFWPHLRESAAEVRALGNEKLALRLEEYLEEERKSLPELLAWCEENGYTYYGKE